MSCENGVLHNVENNLNVLSVRRSGEVAIQLLTLVLSNGVEHAHQVLLNVRHFAWVALEIREVVADRLVLDFFKQKIRLVEKKDDRHASETAVVDYRVEDIDALNNAVGHAIFKNALIKRT